MAKVKESKTGTKKERLRLKGIDEILKEVAEDKSENLSTTSFKFKRDVWDFFYDDSFLNTCVVEFGTHKGQSTRLLSFLFDKVYTINLPGHFSEAQRLNLDRTNICYVPMDLYGTAIDDNFVHRSIKAFFIDAGHETDQVLTDFARCKNLKMDDGDVYFIFDDYGLKPTVFAAVNQLIYTKQIEKVKYIGHYPRYNFGSGGRGEERILTDYEGIICKLVR